MQKLTKEIAHKLNETKRSRDAYIARIYSPFKRKKKVAGFDFEIKGRTKSIYSIWNKIKNKILHSKIFFDLFAIRVILNSPLEREKADCWQSIPL